MRNYVRKTELMDKERGDLLTVSRERGVLSVREQDVVALFAPDYPPETRRDILDAFIGWFAGGDAPKLENPLANAFLQTLVNRQKESVQKFIERCNTNRANVKQRGATTVKPENEGQRGVTTVTNIKESNVIVKEISKGKDISFTVRNGVTRGQEPRMPVSPTVDEPVKDESVKEINMIAPPIDEKHYSADDRQFYDDCVEDGDFRTADSILDFTLRTIDETDNPITRNALRKYLKDVGEEKFKLAAFRFDTDLTTEKEKIVLWQVPING